MYEKKSIYVKIVRGIPMPCSVNYTHKRPLRGHCAPPLQKPSQSVCTFGLTSWGFIVKLCGTRWISLENRSIILLKNGAFSLMKEKQIFIYVVQMNLLQILKEN